MKRKGLKEKSKKTSNKFTHTLEVQVTFHQPEYGNIVNCGLSHPPKQSSTMII